MKRKNFSLIVLYNKTIFTALDRSGPQQNANFLELEDNQVFLDVSNTDSPTPRPDLSSQIYPTNQFELIDSSNILFISLDDSAESGTVEVVDGQKNEKFHTKIYFKRTE